MIADSMTQPLPQASAGTDPARLALLAPGLTQAIAEAGRLLDDCAPEATAQAREVLLSGGKALTFIGETFLATLVAAMTDVLGEAISDSDDQERRPTVQRACAAIRDYMDDVAEGLQAHPLSLFSVYRNLLARRAHPADLTLPRDIDAMALVFPTDVSGKDAGVFPGYAACRSEFERHLLAYFRVDNISAGFVHLRAMHAVVCKVAVMQSDRDASNFWRALQAALAVLASGQVAGDQYVKQFLGQINLQLRHLAALTGGGRRVDGRLLRDALFFISLAPATDSRSAAIKSANSLADLRQRDYQHVRYGQGRDSLRARAQLRRVQNAWESLLEPSWEASRAGAFEHELTQLNICCRELAVPALDELLDGISYLAHDAVQSEPRAIMRFEMARTLLFLEQCLRKVRHLPEHFPDQANAVIEHLTSALSDETPFSDVTGIDDAMAAENDRVAMIAALTELGADVARIEGMLQRCIDSDDAPGGLSEAALFAEQLACVAEVLQLAVPHELLSACAADIRMLADAGPPIRHDATLSRLVHNLAVLSLSLPVQRNMAENLAAADVQPAGTPATSTRAATPGLMDTHARARHVSDPDAVAEDEVDIDMLDIFLLEAEEVLAAIGSALAASRQEPENATHVAALRRAFHTLKGSGRMVGLNALGTGAMAVEAFLNAWLADERSGTSDDYAVLEYAAAELSAWVGELAEQGRSSRQPAVLIMAIERVRKGNGFALPPTQPGGQSEPLSHDDADEICRIGELELSVRLHQIYSEESAGLLNVVAAHITQWQRQLPTHIAPEMLRATHSLKSSSASVRFSVLQELAHPLNDLVQFLEGYPGLLTPSLCSRLMDAVTVLQVMQKDFTARRMPSQREDVRTQLRSLLDELEAGRRQAAAARSSTEDADENSPLAHSNAIEDEIDPELLEIFLEEGRDLLPQVGESLYKLQHVPGDSALIHYLLRPLHTIKGSARMAGAMRLGQHIHDLESRIGEITRDGPPSVAMVEELLARYDEGLQLFETLQASAATGTAAAVVPAAMTAATIGTTAANAHHSPAIAPGEAPPEPDAESGKTTATAPLVRIRAGVLDSLLNQAGEISISRSGLETHVSLLRDHLADLGDNVARLGMQLRKVQIQAEIQIAASNQRQPQNQHFDPLEFDRFTHLQELTRTLAESVDDVASLQKNLLDTVDHAQNSLVQQARMTREMQRELMHARMVKFNGIEERLHRLVRQLAKETGKELRLQIVGSAVELDRSILEKMVGFFEHLLRNAAAHGIETAQQRRAAGKDPAGRLLLEVRQEGNEAMIRLSDDGSGLDLERIREKAIEQGLIGAGQEVSDIEVMSVIFHPGFSTSDNVTAIAGRGVGMDVVRSEVASLGGRISINTIAGSGVQFIIHLPLSLAVAQVVLLELAGQSYAIPSLLVEQVLQLKSAAQAQVFRDGVLDWQDRKLPVHYLSALLGDDRGVPSGETLPVMVVKSGHDFLAILVDHVVGNREVVTKSIGPQLAHMVGVVGATVLGNGSIVLILNPIQLVQRRGYRKGLRHVAPGPTKESAVKKTMLVVDDSLTVRRVMHRLLTREGYHVVLATDGVDALHQLQKLRPDMVLLDIEMPRMDGFDLTRNIRDMYDAATLPIIMITSRTAAKHRERAMELGVNEYLGKPYQDDVLLKMIRGLIGNDGVRPEFCVDDVLFRKPEDQEKE